MIDVNTNGELERLGIDLGLNLALSLDAIVVAVLAGEGDEVARLKESVIGLFQAAVDLTDRMRRGDGERVH